MTMGPSWVYFLAFLWYLLNLTSHRLIDAAISVPGDYSTLALAVAAVNGGVDEIIELEPSELYSITSEIDVTSNVRIRSSGSLVTVTGSSNRLFTLASGSSLSITGLNVSGFASTSSGAVIYLDNANLTVADSVFSGNGIYTTQGGVVYAVSPSWLSFIGSNFTGNTAADGGVIYIASGSGATQISAKRCRFENNNATDNESDRWGDGRANGGVVFYEGILDQFSIESCDFIGNQADYIGSVITCGTSSSPEIRNLVISDSSFVGNVAQYGAVTAYGGANVTLQNSVIENNEAMIQCAFGYMKQRNTWEVDDCIFRSQMAGSLNTAKGAAFFLGETSDSSNSISVSNSLFDGNFNDAAYDDAHGGAIYANSAGSVILKNCNFSSNSGDSGGALYVAESPVNISGCRFVNNSCAEDGGGAIYLAGNNIANISSSVFLGNSAPGSLMGGALFLSSGDAATVERAVFSNNSAKQGGAFRLDGAASLTLRDTLVEGNLARGDGGGFSITSDAAAVLRVEGGAFRGNVALDDGGAGVLQDDNVVLLIGGNFTGNAAAGDGGALMALGGRLVAEGARFGGNAAPGRLGGALYVEKAAAALRACTLAGNRAGSGGAISGANEASINISSSLLEGNAAENGGALDLDTYSYLVAVDSDFRNNSASALGGALYLSSSSYAHFDGCIFEQNTGVDNGGAISAKNAGGLVVRGSALRRNTAGSGGGGLAAFSTPVRLEGSALANNTASNGGAVISWFSSVVARDCEFTANKATKFGGGLQVQTTSFLDASGCLIMGNAAGNSGGGLSVYQSDLSLDSTRIAENEASYNAGGLFLFVGLYNITNSTIESNSAGGLAGGAYLSNCQDASEMGRSCLIDGIDVRKNSAGESGGGLMVVHSTDSTCLLHDMTITHNAAAVNGGGLAVMDAIVNITNLNASHNNASTGGGLYGYCDTGVPFTLADFVLESNLGGGAHFTGGCGLNVSAGALQANHGGQAPAIFVEFTATTRFHGVTVQNHSEYGKSGLDYMSTMIIYSSDRIEIEDCLFDGNGRLDDASLFGGGLWVADSPGTLTSTIFRDNEAWYGGALYVSGSSAEDGNCTVQMEDATFTENTAGVAGGAIYWDNWRPCGAETAERRGNGYVDAGGGYGKFVASGVARLGVEYDLPGGTNSGATLEARLAVCLRDHHGNNVATRNESAILAALGSGGAGNGTAALSGTRLELFLERGCAVFDELVITREPNTTATLTFLALNEDGTPSATESFGFRDCKRGEVLTQTGTGFTCSKCEYGYYTPSANDTGCHECPTGAVCYGGDVVKPLAGYWAMNGTQGLCEDDEGLDGCEFFECGEEDWCRGDSKMSGQFTITKFGYELTTTKDKTAVIQVNQTTIVVQGEIHTVKEVTWDSTSSSGTITLWDAFTGSSGVVDVYIWDYAKCREGHTGNMCSSCKEGYGADSDGYCQECRDDLTLSVVIMCLGILAIFCFGLVMLKMELDRVGEKTDRMSVLMKIFSSYLQLIGIFSYVDLDWPSYLDQLFTISEGIARTGSRLIQTSCVLNQLEGGGQTVFLNTFLFYMCVPPAGVLFAYALWWSVYGLRRARWARQPWGARPGTAARLREAGLMEDELVLAGNLGELRAVLAHFGLAASEARAQKVALALQREHFPDRIVMPTGSAGQSMNPLYKLEGAFNLDMLRQTYIPFLKKDCMKTALITVIILLFLIQPQAAYYSMLVFTCEELAQGEYYLVADYNERCWTRKHMLWVGFGSIPGMLVYTFGLPAAAALILRAARGRDAAEGGHRAEDNPYGFLYEGFQARFYYWECVIMVRKTLIVFVAVFISPYSDYTAGLVGFGVGLIFLVLQLETNPYADDALNRCEALGLVAASFTLLMGIFFEQDEVNSAARIVIGCFIVIFNATFIGYLGYVGYRDAWAMLDETKNQVKALKKTTTRLIHQQALTEEQRLRYQRARQAVSSLELQWQEQRKEYLKEIRKSLSNQPDPAGAADADGGTPRSRFRGAVQRFSARSRDGGGGGGGDGGGGGGGGRSPRRSPVGAAVLALLKSGVAGNAAVAQRGAHTGGREEKKEEEEEEAADPLPLTPRPQRSGGAARRSVSFKEGPPKPRRGSQQMMLERLASAGFEGFDEEDDEGGFEGEKGSPKVGDRELPSSASSDVGKGEGDSASSAGGVQDAAAFMNFDRRRQARAAAGGGLLLLQQEKVGVKYADRHLVAAGAGAGAGTAPPPQQVNLDGSQSSVSASPPRGNTSYGLPWGADNQKRK